MAASPSTTVPHTTYAEACDHVEAQFVATNGLVAGGTFMVLFSGDLGLVEVELRMVNGMARSVA